MMATQSPAKKRPKLSLKCARKSKPHITDDDPPDYNGNEDIEGNDDCQEYEDQCALQEETKEMPAPYCGLYNLGNTCYFNSVLQALRYSPGFCEGLRRLADVAQDWEESVSGDGGGDADSKQSKVTVGQDSRPLLQLVVKLNQLFEEMAMKEDKFLHNPTFDQDMGVYPEEVLNAVRELNPMFQGYLQHDSQELLCCLLSQLQEASQKVLQIAKDEKQNPKRYKHSKLSLVSSKSSSEQSVSGSSKVNKKLEHSSVSGSKTAAGDEQMNDGKGHGVLGQSSPKTPDGTISLENSSDASSSNGGNGGKNGHATSGGSGEGKQRKRTSSTRDSETETANDDQTPVRKVKRRSRSLTPSSDSVVKGKSRSPASDQCINGANGNNSNGKIVNGSGDAGEKTRNGSKANSGKKKRLGVGRIRVPINQPTILSKFGFSKKDGTPVNGLNKDLMCNGEASGSENGTQTSSHMVNGNSDCKTLLESDVKNSQLVCYNQTNNNSNQTQPHVPNSPKKTTKQVHKLKSENTLSPSKGKKADCLKTTTPTGSKKKEGCVETGEADVECVGTVSSLDKYLQIVEKMFQGSLVLRTRCMECEGFTERREDFQDISVPVQRMDKKTEEDEDDQIPEVKPNNLSLSWALSEFACAERLTAENKYFCESCRHHAEAERTMLFGSLPPVLSIQLKRFCAFSGSLAFGGVSKVNNHLATPLSLCLNQWCTRQCRQRKQKYALYAVVMHSGVSSSSGHYVCYVRIPGREVPSMCFSAMEDDWDGDEEVWGHFDDERVTLLSDHEFGQVLHPINGSLTTATPYLLFYKRVEMS